jgi:predicted secreted acid phosphatase
VNTEKLNAGKLEMGQRESVYVHQKKDAPVLTLQLLDETIIEKHNSQTYTVLQHRTHDTHDTRITHTHTHTQTTKP